MGSPIVEKSSVPSGMSGADIIQTNAIGPCTLDPCQKFQLGDGKTVEICIYPVDVYVRGEQITDHQYSIKFKF